jgi:UDP-N-acetylmuramate dehydrogenase
MNAIEKIKNLNFPCEYQTNISFANNSWFGVGGPCDVVFKINDINILSEVIKLIPQDIKILPIGVTSNLLIGDSGFRGVIIRPRFLDIKLLENNQIEVGTGVLDSNIAKYCAENSISGLEFLYTIPGTIGGAIAMNAGCYENDLANVLVSAMGVNKSTGEIKTFKKHEINFSYRNNPVKNFIWVSAILQGNKEKSQDQIYQNIDKFYQQRTDSQPKSCKTGGSTFCNPELHKAWELIEKVGLRGFRIGGACFSDKHCNFIINDRNAKAQDIIDLIELAEKLVFEKFEIKLKREIEII